MSRLRMYLSLVVIGAGILSVHAQEPVGVVVHEAGAWEGYNLFSPLDGAGSYLIDNAGRVVHFWDSEYRSYISYLRDNGNLIRSTSFGNGGRSPCVHAG